MSGFFCLVEITWPPQSSEFLNCGAYQLFKGAAHPQVHRPLCLPVLSAAMRKNTSSGDRRRTAKTKCSPENYWLKCYSTNSALPTPYPFQVETLPLVLFSGRRIGWKMRSRRWENIAQGKQGPRATKCILWAIPVLQTLTAEVFANLLCAFTSSEITGLRSLTKANLFATVFV